MVIERQQTLNLLRVFVVATIIAGDAALVLTEPQTDAARHYSQRLASRPCAARLYPPLAGDPRP